MGVRILHDRQGGHAALYCSVSDWAFGPVFYDDDDATAADQAECFTDWLPLDARRYTDQELARKYAEWRALPKCWDHIAVQPCEKCAETDGDHECSTHGPWANEAMSECPSCTWDAEERETPRG